MSRNKEKATTLFIIATYLSALVQVENSPRNTFIFGTLNYLIISFIVMIIPLTFRVKNKKKLDYLRGFKICLANSLLMFIISIILSTLLIKGEGYYGINRLGAIAYYFVNMSFFVDNKNNSKKR